MGTYTLFLFEINTLNDEGIGLVSIVNYLLCNLIHRKSQKLVTFRLEIIGRGPSWLVEPALQDVSN